MDSNKVIQRNKLAVIVWIASVILLYAAIYIFSRVDNPYFLDCVAGFIVGVIFLSATYLAYASFRYRSSLSQLRRWLTLLPAILILSLLYRMIYNWADYDYAVMWEGEGKIRGNIRLSLNTEGFYASKTTERDWNTHVREKLPSEVRFSWVGSDGIQHSQTADLRGRLPFIQNNMQILFTIFPDHIEAKVAKRPDLFRVIEVPTSNLQR